MSNVDDNKGLLHTLQEYSIPLILGVVGSLLWANLSPHGYHHAIHLAPLPFKLFGHALNLHFFANEIVMALFFGIAASEITESALPGGPLNPPKKAINPLLGTIGGVLGPIGVYFLMTRVLNAPEIANGWGIPTATDIALAWLVAKIVFGPKHPAVSFLLLLAVADDALGLGIIAVFYPDPLHPVALPWLALVAAAMAVAYGFRRAGVARYALYLAIPGVMSWFGLLFAHLHPALALVVVVPFMPAAERDDGMYTEGTGTSSDTLNRFQHAFELPVTFGLGLFGLTNAGVELSSMGPATWTVLAALVVGKTVGITVLSYGGHLAGFSLPEGMSFKTLVLAGLTAALGLTVALFVAGVAFTDPGLQGAAKMGALFSAFVAPVVIVLGRVFGVVRITESDSDTGGDAVAKKMEEPS